MKTEASGTPTLDHEACYRAICLRDPRFDGRFFTAVRTTRVYCRPICPAPTPRADNVTFYPTAASAQSAGFHPCMRCRPETAPNLGAWRGTSNTISRALSLIELGALDDADVDSLADRLGVGGRHLRRLFREHLGASPVAVAQTHRVLLAKQLIHETDLPMTEVAFAAGFGSVRRFNESFIEVFGCPPSELRGEIGTGMRPEISLLLPYQPPYDWQSMLEFLQRRAIPGVERIVGNRYERTVDIGDEYGTLGVEPGDGHSLRVVVRFPKLSALPIIIARVRRVFDLAADTLAINEYLARDGTLAPLVAARPGLRVPGAWDGFELAIRAVLGQQITVTAAIRLAGKLVAAHGQPLAQAEEGLTHTFPRPQALANVDLVSLGVPRSRAKTLSSVATATLERPELFEQGASLEEAINRLRSIWGVGEWTAQYIALRQYREPDAFPAADVGLLRALERLEGRTYTPAELLARSGAWRPWRAYAAQHLWTGG